MEMAYQLTKILQTASQFNHKYVRLTGIERISQSSANNIALDIIVSRKRRMSDSPDVIYNAVYPL